MVLCIGYWETNHPQTVFGASHSLSSLSWRTKLWEGWTPGGIVFQRDKLPQNITRRNLSVWKAAFLRSNCVSVVTQKPCNLEKTEVRLASSLWKVFNLHKKLDTQRKHYTKKNLNSWTFIFIYLVFFFFFFLCHAITFILTARTKIISGLYLMQFFSAELSQICLNWDV